MFKLTPEQFKRKWVEELRSGRRVQAQTSLGFPASDRYPERFCCLGVACEVYLREGGDGLVRTESEGAYAYNSQEGRAVSYLPRPVADALGIDPNPAVCADQAFTVRLVHLNDSGFTFSEIADCIEHMTVQ